jgi:type I restriction enzyme S subunit
MEKQKNMPQLRFPEFEGEWDKKMINDTCTIVGGGTPESGKDEFWNGNIQWFTPTEIKMDYVSKSERTITELGLKKSSARLLPKGTILLTSRATIGEVAIALNECTTNQGFQSLIVNKSFNSIFIFNWIKNNRNQFIRRANGSTFLEISKSEIGTIQIFTPSLPEQQKIASFFTAIDQKISQIKRKLTLLEQYKKGVMQKIFSQEIRFKDDIGQEFPMWEKMKLGNFLIQKIREVPKPNSTYMAIGVRSHCKGTFQRVNSEPDKIEMDKLYVIKKGDLVVNITFAWEGAIAMAKEEDDGGLVSHRFPTYVFNEEKVLGTYFQYVFIQSKFRELLDLISPGGAGRNRVLSKKDFLKLTCDVPCIEEQSKIANFLSAIDDKTNHTQKQIEKAEVWKKGLMQQMFV